MSKATVSLVFLCLSFPMHVDAQRRFFVGGVAGVSTLSADTQTSISPGTVAFSTYRPFNGAAVNLFSGALLNDYISIQGNYVWNRNDITATLSSASPGSFAVNEEQRDSSQHSGILDLLLYFRSRESWARPYLSVGSGVIWFKSERRECLNRTGTVGELPLKFTSNEIGLRVAVGIDVRIRQGLSLRYTFSETIRGNPVSSRLSPRGEGNLANFQNLVGIVKYF